MASPKSYTPCSVLCALVVVVVLCTLATPAASGYVWCTNITVPPNLTGPGIIRNQQGSLIVQALGYGDHRVSVNTTLLAASTASPNRGLFVFLSGSGGQV